MTALAQLFEEKLRRDRESDRIREAIGTRFVVHKGQWTLAVKRNLVYQHVAKTLDMPIVERRSGGLPDWQFCQKVRKVVLAMGARSQHGDSWSKTRRNTFLGIEDKESQPEYPRGLQDSDVGRLRRSWYARLRREGFDDIESPGGMLKRGTPTFRKFEFEHNREFFRQAAALYWSMRRETDVWGLYVMESLTLREIETRTGIPKSNAHRIIERVRARMGRHGIEEDEDGHGEDMDSRGSAGRGTAGGGDAGGEAADEG